MAGNDNGKKSHTDRVRTLAKYIAEQPDDDEITGQHLIDAMKAGVALGVETTSKTRAMSKQEAEEITLTDHGAKKQESDAPPSKVSPVTVVFVAVRRLPPWGLVIVALAGIAAYVVLKR